MDANNVPVKFEDAVKARLNGIVSELIPEDRWDELVRRSVLEFEQQELPKLVKSELADMFKAQIMTALSSPDFQVKYGSDGRQIASDMVSKLIQEQAPLILAQVIGASVQATVWQLQNNVSAFRG